MRTLVGLGGICGVIVSAAACATGASVARESAPPQVVADEAIQLARYVQVQEALAADAYADARAALETLATIGDDTVRPLARAAGEAGDLAAMREGFKPLSDAVVGWDLPRGYAAAYCPMFAGGSNWIQRDGPVRNPYYGSAMLTCGVVDAAPGAHMDHTPRHGGIVFMAPDSFHHLEGTYSEPGVFRLYVTDNFREPVNVSVFSGRAVTEESYVAATDEFREVTAFELVSSAEGAYLEASVEALQMPADVIAKVVFEAGFPEERFDFIFAELSVENRETPALAVVGGISGAPENIPLAERIRPRIPAQAGDIASEISSRDLEIQTLIERGAFTELFIPALQAKELALALIDHGSELPEDRQNVVKIAVRSLVRSAWLLDWYGDLGNKNQVDEAYEIFGAAVGQIAGVYQLR